MILKMFSRFFFTFFSMLLIFTCTDQTNRSDQGSDLDTLAAWMAGSFSSEAQSLSDSSYRHVRLHMIPIWQQQSEGYWFYIEQSIAGYEDRPYRQRIYHLVQQDDSTFRSDVFVFNNPLRFAGNWQTGEAVKGLTPDSLELREGCSIFLQRHSPEIYSGSTRGEGCESTLRGASYATSEVTITKTEMISWDRGFDDHRVQVWGAEKGGYIFKKITRIAVHDE